MDEMKIESKLMTAIVSRIIKRIVCKKFGYCIGVKLNEFHTTVINEKTHMHIDVDLEVSKEELDKILKDIGL